jgi:glycosyltransferase involved in cell wall biosynthesis
MIKQKIHIGILIREIFSEEGTGSLVFVKNFLNLPHCLNDGFEYSFIIETPKKKQGFKGNKLYSKHKFISLSDYNPNKHRVKLSFLESIKFKVGSWIKKITQLFFIEIKINHPRLISEFDEFSQQQMELLIDENKIDLMVYPFWFDYPTINRPFIIFYWDAAHRYLSFMPDLAVRKVETVFKPALENAFKVIVPNKAAIDELESLYKVGQPNSKFSIIPFSFPPPEINSSDNFDYKLKETGINDPFIFYPAGFWPHKNHVVLVDAIHELNMKGNHINVVMTGPDRGNYEYIKSLIVDKGMEDQFHYLGFVKREFLCYLYQNCIALVYPSIVGPNNYPPIEAASLGCPVLLSDIPGHREQMRDAAVYFEKFNPSQLAEKIELLINDRVLRETLIHKGTELAEAIQPQAYLESLKKVFEEFAQYRKLWGKHYTLNQP